MGENSKIEWTDHTFNPWIGCQRVSPGCEHCYAETQDSRKRWGGITHWGPTAPRHRTSESTWAAPMKWNREAQAAGVRRRVFCASLADVFEDREELAAWRIELFTLIGQTQALDWLLLTKRPENIARFMPKFSDTWNTPLKPWPNVWLGTTVEDQQRADERIPALLKVPAVVRFLSVEPMLEAINIERPGRLATGSSDVGFNWVICGGESGPSSRPFDTAWARDLRDECKAAGVPFFMKQLGQRTRMRPSEVGGDPELTPMVFPMRKGEAGNPATWPEDLRVRQFPEAKP